MAKAKKRAGKREAAKRTGSKKTAGKTAGKTAAEAAKRSGTRKTASGTKGKIHVGPLPPERLRWRCGSGQFPFASTIEVEPLSEVAVQQTAVKTLQFGLETRAPGHNIFVRGMTGTHRQDLVRLMCEELRESFPLTQDRCYVHNFTQPDRPRLISLPPGRSRKFRACIDGLIEFIRQELGPILESDVMKQSRESLSARARSAIESLVKPFEAALQAAGLALVTFQSGMAAQAAVYPVVEGKTVPPEEFEQLYAAGHVLPDQYDAYKKNADLYERELEGINRKASEIRRNHDRALERLVERTTRWVLRNTIHEIEEAFPQQGVRLFLNELVDDLLLQNSPHSPGVEDFTRRYRVNMVLEHRDGERGPVVTDHLASGRSLLGTVDYEFSPAGEGRVSHMGIRAGSLLSADGGILILDVRDLYRETEAWKILARTLRTGLLEIVPWEAAANRSGPTLQPEAIPIAVKVVLIGDAESYHLFEANDRDFASLFKVVVDFQSVIPRDEKGIRVYAQLLARLSLYDNLPPYDSTAVTALVEEGARLAGLGDKLTTRFGLLQDIAYESAHVAVKGERKRITDADVHTALRRARERADLPARVFREQVARGKIRVETRGAVVGQVNGMAVMQAGLLSYGFPARITATIGPGTAGVINIEREAALSGAIHTKGFYILGGLLRHLLRTDHPLAFEASVAFEQSYGGIDGDSASGAEICCLLSALTGVPLRQDLAMTGAIDQTGHVLAVGAVNEKIEGFFDVCLYVGLTGSQGVIVPESNVPDLMLREDVVEACETGRFRVYGVKNVKEALELLTGMPAGLPGTNGAYPRGTLLRLAVDQARAFWLKGTRGGSVR